MKKIIYTVTVMLSVITMLNAENSKITDGVFQLNFNAYSEQKVWSNADFSKWTKNRHGSTSLCITVPEEKADGGHMIHRSIDLNPYRGYRILLECSVKAESVTKPPLSYFGTKFMIHYKSEKEGEIWQNPNNVYGTFDWKTIKFAQRVAQDATDGELYLGLQGSAGKVWFDNIKITVVDKPIAKRPLPAAENKPAFKGHNLPRLRGVMSPCEFYEEDIRVLGEDWNANVIRWQLSRNWGEYNTDRDINEYNEWLDRKITELDKVIKACEQYGVKVVVDIHSPPGGRYPNGEMAIFHEEKYQQDFVDIWEKIAKHYKDNTTIWGYDLINEPVQKIPPPSGTDDYLTLQTRTAKAIRKIDQKMPIFVTGPKSGSASGYKELNPINVPNIVYQVHVYDPMDFTHQGVLSDKWIPVKYPGVINGQKWNKEKIRELLHPVREFQLAYNVHIYVGEFSAIRWAEGAAQYLSDCIELFEEYDWDWSYHSYREWHGWNVDCGDDMNNKNPTKEPSDRKLLLLKWFKQNKQRLNLDIL